MTDLIRPAPLWRRLASSVYDGLLLLGLWMVAALFDIVVRDALKIPHGGPALQTLLFVLGLAFFGWFWTHGGQTLGMRSWRLQVRRDDGSALRWPVASLRYVVMLTTWLVALLPGLMRLPGLAKHAYAQEAMVVSLILIVVGAALSILDRRKRVVCDWFAGTEVVELPKKA